MRMRIGRGAYYNGMWEEAHEGAGAFGDRGQDLVSMPWWMMRSMWGRWWFGVGNCPTSSM